MRSPCFLVTYCTGKTRNNQEKCALCSYKRRNEQNSKIKVCKMHLILLRRVKRTKSSVKNPLLFVMKLTLFFPVDGAILRFGRIEYHFMAFFLTPCRTADLNNPQQKTPSPAHRTGLDVSARYGHASSRAARMFSIWRASSRRERKWEGSGIIRNMVPQSAPPWYLGTRCT